MSLRYRFGKRRMRRQRFAEHRFQCQQRRYAPPIVRRGGDRLLQHVCQRIANVDRLTGVTPPT